MPKQNASQKLGAKSDQLHQDFITRQNDLNSRLNATADYSGVRSERGYDELRTNYQSLLDRARAGAFSGGASSRNRDYLSDFAESGGWTPGDRGEMEGDINTLRGYAGNLTDWADNPIDDTAKARWRGGGLYDEFAKTGGIAEGTRQMMRSRGNSVTGSLASGLRSEMENQAAKTGRPVSAAALSQGSRHLAQEAGNTAVNTELGISDAVNQGRRWGAEGMTSSEGSLQNYLKEAKLGGYGLASEDIRSAGGLRQAMMDSINRGREFGMSGLMDADRMDMEGDRLNLSAEQIALAGQAGLQAQDVQQYQQTMNYLMQNQGLSAQEAQAYIQQQAQINPHSSKWKKIGGVAKIIGGAAITYFSGGALAPVGVGLAAGGIGDLTSG